MARPRKVAAEFRAIRVQDKRISTFMRRHYGDLAVEFAAGIDWAIAMAVFQRNHLCDEHGQPVSLATASRTWRRVRREMEAREVARVAAAPPSLRPGEVAPGVHALPQIPNRLGYAAASVPAPAPASAGVGATPGPVPATASGTPAPQVAAGTGATEQIRDVLGRLGARRVPLPQRN